MCFKLYSERNAVHSVPPLVLFLEFSWSFLCCCCLGVGIFLFLFWLLFFKFYFNNALNRHVFISRIWMLFLKYGSGMFFDNTERQICFLCYKLDVFFDSFFL